jgi:homoserine O-succinyltransferase/O-acetyltransferase
MRCFASDGLSTNVSRQFREWDANCIHIGLINNMPGPAMEATERRFCTLLDAAAEGFVVRVSRYALPGVPWSPEGMIRIDNCYSNINRLWNAHLDGLIVTGAEPLAPALTEEVYWGPLATVVEWAEHNTYSSIWSCLAAHAAVFQIDGIDRCPLDDKRFGLFECARVSDDSLTARLSAGVPERVRVPHSRWNDIPGDGLKAYGYRVLTRSDNAGIDAFVKQRKSLFVFFQGHPEYDADTLLLEYRRDIRRFLRRERESYPSMPQGCIEEQLAGLFTALRERALSDRREELLADFPAALLAARVKNTWRPSAISIYRNWLRYLSERKLTQKKGWQTSRPAQPEYARISDVSLGPLLKTDAVQTRETGGDNPS